MMRKAELIKQNLLKRREGRTDVRNMCKVLLIVECEYISEDSKGRLYLSQVQEVRNPAVRMRSTRASVIAAKLILSGALTAPPAAWSVIYAFLERGYKAYGGEYLFIIMFFLVVYWALGKFITYADMDIL
ncbi:hypothetical protein C823_005136 [Eubacterium plexicaudatum ASF492]|uniref:Uncharacterized protein n=1 Tax=Eubacterium plexicaudatum ASF492 TaxID=1235802 RepID=N1ZY56_9FIRM|nr:hypothetical protein C823_005136 [Eubacterium plexicaudatum ASF492]